MERIEQKAKIKLNLMFAPQTFFTIPVCKTLDFVSRIDYGLVLHWIFLSQQKNPREQQRCSEIKKKRGMIN